MMRGATGFKVREMLDEPVCRMPGLTSALTTGGDGDAVDDAAETVIVKSYRDSATYKRRHGIPLDVPPTPQGPDVTCTAEAASGRRARGAVVSPAPVGGVRRRAPVPAASQKAARPPSRSMRDAVADGVVLPSLPPWVSRLPELAAARKHPLHSWASHALRSALAKGGVAVPAAVAVENGRKHPRQGRTAADSGKPRRAAQSTAHPRGAAASAAAGAAVTAINPHGPLIDAGWMSDGMPQGGVSSFGADTAACLVDVPWRHDAF